MSRTLHIITGTTGVGKTRYALRYAEQHDAEIVSGDAFLVYRGMDIGTAKPNREELARIPHHLIDLLPVNEHYDITDYVRDAKAAVEEIVSRGRSIVVAGGSGFYLKSFFAPVLDSVVVSDTVRAEVAALYQSGGLDGLLVQLRKKNPAGFGNLDLKNPRRVLRALERCEASGKSLPELQAEFAGQPTPYSRYTKRCILLERDKEELRDRVTKRAQSMLRDGLIEEVEALLKAGIRNNPSAASAIGYRETIAYLENKLKKDHLLPLIVQNTMHLVKKQNTWFRTQMTSPDQRIALDTL